METKLWRTKGLFAGSANTGRKEASAIDGYDSQAIITVILRLSTTRPDDRLRVLWRLVIALNTSDGCLLQQQEHRQESSYCFCSIPARLCD